MPDEEREFGESTWDWFWLGAGIGVIYQAIRNPGGCCCCLLLVALIVLFVGGLGALLVFTHWEVIAPIALAYVLWRYVALPWLRERRGPE